MERKILKKIICKYQEKQLIVAIEELSELQKELCKALRGKANIENITEEIADSLLMIEQIKLYFNIDTKQINDILDAKIKRTKERYLQGEQ